MTEVTVLMTTYNEPFEYLSSAIDSILNQTLKSFDLLIIVDNPDNVDMIDKLMEYIKIDKRIKVIVNEQNLNLANSLNKGIDMIKTPYIARMDADDISKSDRLEKELLFLKTNPNIDLVGTNITYIDEQSKVLRNRGSIPSNYILINKIMRYENVFNHPTFMGRTSVFKTEKYRGLLYSQDYDFTCRLIEKGYTLANIDEPLLLYRVTGIVSSQKKFIQIITKHTIQKHLRTGTLNNIDIILEVNDIFEKIDKSDVLKSIKFYGNAIEQLRLNHFFRAFYLFIRCFISSKTGRNEVYNLIRYYLLKSIGKGRKKYGI